MDTDYEKVIAVIKSCCTEGQLEIAAKMVNRYRRRAYVNSDRGFVHECEL
jgi:hypothetical protein